MKASLFVVLLFASACAMSFNTQISRAQQPVELGTVNWNRDLDAAYKLSEKSGKPLFVQFQEVPG